MGRLEQMRNLGRSAFAASDNWITILGVILTTGAGFTQVWSWFLEFASPHTVHPYVGIVLFMVLPMFFVLGLVLIPAGILLRRRKLRKEGHLPDESPKVDLASPHIRRVLVFVAAS